MASAFDAMRASDPSSTPAMSPRSHAGAADIVQFACPMSYGEESERKVTVEIMRLGSLNGEVSVNYTTEDASAKAGERYTKAEGHLVFQDGETTKSIEVEILEKQEWSPTMEFKIRLTDPDNCYLGLYLQSCTVKVMDDDIFPSSRFREAMMNGKEGVRDVNSYALFYEYLKMNFRQNGIHWKTVVVLVFDQLPNIYMYMKLTMSAYLVNIVFNLQVDDHDLFFPGDRGKTAQFIGLMYIVPMLVLHVWDDIKIRLDIEGHSKVLLASCLFRKYLNYNEDSRRYVAPSEMQLGLLTETADLAGGYSEALTLVQHLGKLFIMICFVTLKNPRALWMILLMPVLIAAFAYARGASIASGRRERDKRERELIAVIGQTCEKYALVKNYFRRSARSEMFQDHADSTRQTEVPVHVVMNNNLYASRWMGPVFIGMYICVFSGRVLKGELPIGFFLATVSILDNMSQLFLDVYKGYQRILEISEPLQTLCIYYNLETDMREFKTATEAELKWMHTARAEAMTRPQPPPETKMMRTDLIPIRLENLTFNYGVETVLDNVTLMAPQGTVVGIRGSHGCGKSTLCHLLGRTIVPHKGNVFIPPHLRVLFVSQEPTILLDLTLWENLTMGCPGGIDEGLVMSILQELGMDRAMDALDHFKQASSRNNNSFGEESAASSRDLLLGSPGNSSRDLSATEVARVKTPEEKAEIAGRKEELRKELAGWFETLNYTMKAKIHLARAFIMNPEVMVMLRPLYHFDDEIGKSMLIPLQQHHRNRGLCMPVSTIGRRRPRTVFMTCDTDWQEAACDMIWNLGDTGSLTPRRPSKTNVTTADVDPVDPISFGSADRNGKDSVRSSGTQQAGSQGMCVRKTWMNDLCFAPKSNRPMNTPQNR